MLDPATKTSVTHFKVTKPKAGTRQLWGVVSTATNGVVFFTSNGAYNSPSSGGTGIAVWVSALSAYNTLVTTTGTSVLDGNVIPGTSLLMLLLDQKGEQSMITYDASADTFISNSGPAAPTNYMLAYTYGVCDGKPKSELVELTFSNDFSHACQLPKTGLYYQSENQYFAIPYSCLGIAYDKLLTNCAEIKANMKALVDDTCADSISKICSTQYSENAPYACIKEQYTPPLTVISLAGSNTMAIAGVLAGIIAGFLRSKHNFNYRATDQERADCNFKHDRDDDDVSENGDNKADNKLVPTGDTGRSGLGFGFETESDEEVPQARGKGPPVRSADVGIDMVDTPSHKI